MSMIMQYIRIRDEELATLRAMLVAERNRAFDYADELADGDDEGVPAERSRSLDTDKSWDAIAFLLRRYREQAGDEAVDVVHGGIRLTEDEWGYESPRYLTPDEVRRGASQLDAVPFERLAVYFEPALMSKVYPQIWADDDALAYLRDWYAHLAAFFRHAAADRDGMIVFLS